MSAAIKVKELLELVKQQVKDNDPDFNFLNPAISDVNDEDGSLIELTSNVKTAFDEWAQCVQDEQSARDEYDSFCEDGEDDEEGSLSDELSNAEGETASAARALLNEIAELSRLVEGKC